ncbi:hypothetical protein Tco_0750061 [Tanacetum coccineum]|uniref:MAK10-like protein n=1 Tax=Tanacetum coccineum TaxID=301880 RepID=A0ABQ4Z0F3_9ASTR
MSVRPVWRKKLTCCNTSNEVDVNLPTPMPKPQSPLKEPSQENPHTTYSNHDSLQSHSLPLGNTNVRQATFPPQNADQTQLTQPSFPHLLINPYFSSVLHAQTPSLPQGDNQTQPSPPPSPSREMLIDDLNQLQDLSNLLAMHLSQCNTPSPPYSPNLPYTLNLNQVEQHVGYCPLAGDGVTCIKRCRRDQSSNGVRIMATVSRRGRLKEDLESSMWRRRQDHKATSSQDLALYDNKSQNDRRDFVKPVKAISLPQDVPSTSDRRLVELENQVQRLMEAHLAPTQPTQVNKITTSCEICSGPHDTQYCMEDPEQAFVEYASSRTDEAGGKWYTFKPEQNNLGDTYNPSWKSHPNLRWRQPQNSQNNFSNPPNRFQPNGSIPNRPFNNNPQSFNNQSNLEGLVSNFMASQDARLSKFEADFKQQQSEMTNKIDTVLKAITDRIAGALPSDTVKNMKLSTSSVLSARSYPTEDP